MNPSGCDHSITTEKAIDGVITETCVRCNQTRVLGSKDSLSKWGNWGYPKKKQGSTMSKTESPKDLEMPEYMHNLPDQDPLTADEQDQILSREAYDTYHYGEPKDPDNE